MAKRLLSPKLLTGIVILIPIVAFLFGQLGKKIPFPGVQADGTFVLANFERPTDVKAWRQVDSKMVPTIRQAVEGHWSAKVSFLGGKDVSSVMLEDLLKSKVSVSNWNPYQSLEFKILNPEPYVEKIILLITDLWGKRYQEEIAVGGPGWQSFSVPVERVAQLINIKKVNQISFMRRREKEPREFFFDDIRLIPSPDAPMVRPGASGAVHPFDYGFAKRKSAWTVLDPLTQSEIVRVPFIVRNETPALCRLCPAEGGIPMPMGEIRSLNNIRLRNG